MFPIITNYIKLPPPAIIRKVQSGKEIIAQLIIPNPSERQIPPELDELVRSCPIKGPPVVKPPGKTDTISYTSSLIRGESESLGSTKCAWAYSVGQKKTEPSGRPYCPNNQFGWKIKFLTHSIQIPIMYIQELGQKDWATAPSPRGGTIASTSFSFCTNTNQLNIMVVPPVGGSVQRMNNMKSQINALRSLTGQGIMQERG